MAKKLVAKEPAALDLPEHVRRATNLAKIPPICYAVDYYSRADHARRTVMLLERGAMGKRDAEGMRLPGETAEETVDRLNAALGVMVQQRNAMTAGSFHGFHTPHADPDNYRPSGAFIKSRK